MKMGILSRLFGARKSTGSDAASGGDDRNPAHERALKRQFGLDYGKRGWAFEGGRLINDMAAQFCKADISLGVLKDLRAKVPFSQVCVVGGRMVILVCNTKPQPTCIVTGLTPSGVSDLIALAVAGGATVSAYRSTWLLTL